LCSVTTLRADLVEKTITISEAKKATKEAGKSELCKHVDERTVYLIDANELAKKYYPELFQKKP
jgi:hypothetical protein